VDFDQYILTIEKRTVKISLPPDREALEKAFWAGFRYAEELSKNNKNPGGDFGDIFGNLFKK